MATRAPMPKQPPVLKRIGKPKRTVTKYCAVIYARTGMGKTTLLGTMRVARVRGAPPLHGRGLVIDTSQYEGGTEVLFDQRSHIDVVPVYKWEDFDKLYHALRTGEIEYDWVAIDTISGATKMAWRKVLREREEIVGQPYHKRPKDYGSVGAIMGILFAEFRSLPMPVIFLAQESSREDEENEDEVIIGPDITPLSLKELAPHPKLMGRLFVYRLPNGKWERRLRVGIHANYYSKARTIKGRRLPAIIRKPHLGDIFAYMMGGDVPKPAGARDEAPAKSNDLELS